MPKILLATLNARFLHSALGLRYLLANMGDLQPATAIREFTLEMRPADIAEQLLAEEPAIIGFGVYLWNVEPTTRLVALLKAIRPGITIILGGPEVSHEWESQQIVALADYVVTGEGDLAFAQLCRKILDGAPPAEKIQAAPLPSLESLTLPYRCYSDADIAHRLIYVETSRGCPFRCEFCLSALDPKVRTFGLNRVLEEFSRLHQRGVRHFKFVDRTFNLDVESGVAVLEFFLERLDPELLLHFEVVPDRLPERLRETLSRFPAGTLQLEVGVQSFDPEVQARISRRQDNDKSRDNLAWLRRHTRAHLHADLIVGLPGEDLEGFGRGFDRLVALRPHEIQVGILKRLRGTPISRHSEPFGMIYNPDPPYDLLANDRLDFPTLQRLKRFARYWDLIANSGHFRTTLPTLLGDRPFARFLALSDWLYTATGQVHRFALPRLFDLLFLGMTTQLQIPEERTRELLAADYSRGRSWGQPKFLMEPDRENNLPGKKRRSKRRQSRHLE
jgi:radical SAM superfamily enzyme YgiQ (UPF0313 family)